MKLLVLVLNKTEKLEDVLLELAQAGLCGATVLSSTGMARLLGGHDEEEIPFLGSLRALLNPERKKSYTILMVLEGAQIPLAVEKIEGVVGDLSGKDTGIVFSLPIDFAKGLPGCEC